MCRTYTRTCSESNCPFSDRTSKQCYQKAAFRLSCPSHEAIHFYTALPCGQHFREPSLSHLIAAHTANENALAAANLARVAARRKEEDEMTARREANAVSAREKAAALRKDVPRKMELAEGAFKAVKCAEGVGAETGKAEGKVGERSAREARRLVTAEEEKLELEREEREVEGLLRAAEVQRREEEVGRGRGRGKGKGKGKGRLRIGLDVVEEEEEEDGNWEEEGKGRRRG